MKKEPIYLLDPKLKWTTFKKLNDKLVRDSGPKPKNIEKMLWQMMRDKQIYCWYDKKMPGDMRIGLKLPLNRKIILLSNSTPNNGKGKRS